MSRTFKDRPHWVKEYQDDHPIDHDHRDGKCIEETLEYSKYTNGRWQRGHQNCKKDVTLEISCERKKVDGRKQVVFNYEFKSKYQYTRNKNRNQPACWVWACNGHTHGETEYTERWYCKDKYFTYCQGHIVKDRRPEIPCICDDFPERPTCTWSYSTTRPGRRWMYTFGGIPSAFVRTYYHRPERAKERKLKDMAREYNANGYIEDDDFENRQARNSVRWIYW